MNTERGQVDAAAEMDAVMDKLGIPGGEKPAEKQASKPEQEAEGEGQAKAEVTEPETPEAEGEEKGKAEVSEEGDETEEPKLTEEDLQKRVKEQYAGWQSKILAPITKEREELRKQVSDLKDDILLKANEYLFAEESERAGEEQAKKSKAARDRVIEALNRSKHLADMERIFQPLLDMGYKQDFIQNLPENIQDLRNESKRIVCRDLGYKYVPGGDEAVVKAREKFIKDLMGSDEWQDKDIERLAYTKSLELKDRKKVTHKPESNRPSGAHGSGRLTRQNLRDYDISGKTTEQLQKDADAVLEQFTRRR